MLNKLRWFLFGLLAISIGLYPILYFILDRKFGLLSNKSEALLSNLIWNAGFYTHIILSGIALLVGWTQFSPMIREKNLPLHRLLGKIYVFTALPAGLAGFGIAWFATGGIVAMLGFAMLGVLWVSTTLAAYLAIRQMNLISHEKMMVFSYSICFAAVALRLWLPLLISLSGDFITSYRIVAWLCWVPNLIFAIVYTRKMSPDL